VRIGNTEIRPRGGRTGCLVMLAGAVLLSIICTIAGNLLTR
jgi:hypothetical protein